MKFKLEIECDNAAFSADEGADCPTGSEVARILERVAAQILRTDVMNSPVLDTNGNVVGRWQFV